MSKTVIIPIRLDSYAGDISALEAHFFKSSEEYGAKSVPDDSMWIAVYIVNGKIDHSLTEYGYRSLEELLDTHKNEKITGLRENRKDAELERAGDIAEDALGILLDMENQAVDIEGELNLAPGALVNAYKTLQKARKHSQKKPPRVDKDEIFYSLCIEDIFTQADELRIPRKKFTPEVIKRIEQKVEDGLGNVNDSIGDAITDVMNEKGGDD